MSTPTTPHRPPAGPTFRTVVRGYDPVQVDAALQELTRQLEEARRHQADRPPSVGGEQALSARLTSILALADEEAAQRRLVAVEREEQSTQVHEETRRRLAEVLDGLRAVEGRLTGETP